MDRLRIEYDRKGAKYTKDKRKKDRLPRETRDLIGQGGALLAAAAIMLTLLFSAAFPEKVRSVMSEELAPRLALPEAPQPSPSTDPTVYIRLADVEQDVSPEVIIRLMNVEPETEPIDLAGAEPKILIYHTHDTEAYRPTEGEEYEPSGNFRTEDNDHNVFAVGEELVRILREEYGIIAVHASEKHEKPKLTSAYSRSLETMLKYKELYPSIEMFIDLHRDGVADTGYEDDFVTVEGLECARMMFVVGTGSSGKSAQNAPEAQTDAEKLTPDFESNYALAVSLTERLLTYNERFMRNVRVKSGKYNQQVSPRCLLVEVGHNGNTLEQAKNSMRFLARAIAEGMNG